MGHQPQLDCVGADLRMFLCFPQVQPSASTFTSFSSATLLNNKTELARHFGKECEKRSSLFFSLLFPKSCLASQCTLGELSCVQHPASSVGQKRHRSFGYLSEPALLGQDKNPKLFCRLTFRARPGFLKESLFVSITLGFSPISCQYSLLPPLLHVIHTNCHVFIAFLFSTLPCVDHVAYHLLHWTPLPPPVGPSVTQTGVFFLIWTPPYTHTLFDGLNKFVSVHRWCERRKS